MSLLTRKETAQMLRICVSTLDRLTKCGELPCLKVGNKTMYDKDGLIRMLAQGGTK